jgi:hypothetical protein
LRQNGWPGCAGLRSHVAEVAAEINLGSWTHTRLSGSKRKPRLNPDCLLSSLETPLPSGYFVISRGESHARHRVRRRHRHHINVFTVDPERQQDLVDSLTETVNAARHKWHLLIGRTLSGGAEAFVAETRPLWPRMRASNRTIQWVRFPGQFQKAPSTPIENRPSHADFLGPAGHDEAGGLGSLFGQIAAEHEAEGLRGIASREVAHAAIAPQSCRSCPQCPAGLTRPAAIATPIPLISSGPTAEMR